MKTTKLKFVYPNFILSNATAINDVFTVEVKNRKKNDGEDKKYDEVKTLQKKATPFQRLLLYTVADLIQLFGCCKAKYSNLAKRLGVSENYISEGIDFWKRNEYLEVHCSKRNDGNFTKQNTITPTKKLLELLHDKNYIKNITRTGIQKDIHRAHEPEVRSHEDNHRDTVDYTINIPLTPEPITNTNIPLEVADATSSDTKNVSEYNITSEEKFSKEEKNTIFSEPERKLECFAPETSLENLAEQLILKCEQDEIVISELPFKTEMVRELLEKMGVNLNGKFYEFTQILNKQIVEQFFA